MLRWIDAKHEIPKKSTLQHSPYTTCSEAARETTVTHKNLSFPRKRTIEKARRSVILSAVKNLARLSGNGKESPIATRVSKPFCSRKHKRVCVMNLEDSKNDCDLLPG